MAGDPAPQVPVKSSRTLVDKNGVGSQHRAQRVRNRRAAAKKVVVSGAIAIKEIVIHYQPAAGGGITTHPVMAVLIQHVVFDVHPTQVQPEDNAAGAIPSHHVVVNLQVADRGVAGNLQPTGIVSHHHVVDDPFVLSAHVQAVVEVAAAGPTVVVNVVADVNITGGALVVINPIVAVGAGAGRIAVVMDFVVEDLVAVAPDADATIGTIADFEPLNDIVAAVQINRLVAVRGILAVNDGPATHLGLQDDRAGGRAAITQVQPPAAGVVGINTGHDQDPDTWAGEAICVGDGSKGLRGCPRVGIAALRGHIQVSRLNSN